MEKSNKRGKIRQSDWPLIMARYEAGETLASIARTYDCSPPAISYVVSRSRARPNKVAPPADSADPRLVKHAVADVPAQSRAASAYQPAAMAAQPAPDETQAAQEASIGNGQ